MLDYDAECRILRIELVGAKAQLPADALTQAASHTTSALRSVTAKCYCGDLRRKRKLVDKQI